VCSWECVRDGVGESKQPLALPLRSSLSLFQDSRRERNREKAREREKEREAEAKGVTRGIPGDTGRIHKQWRGWAIESASKVCFTHTVCNRANVCAHDTHSHTLLSTHTPTRRQNEREIKREGERERDRERAEGTSERRIGRAVSTGMRTNDCYRLQRLLCALTSGMACNDCYSL